MAQIKSFFARKAITSIGTALIICSFLVIGCMMKHAHEIKISFAYLAAFCILSILVSTIIYIFFGYLDKSKENDLHSKSITANTRVYFSFALILFLIWIPSFLAFYPGIFAYDAQWQYDMFIVDNINTHQPVLHTLLLGELITLGQQLTNSFNKGVALYSLAQMTLMALGLSYIPFLLVRKGIKIGGIITSLLFLAFFPVIVIFVFTSTKDTIFGMAVADFTCLNFFLLSQHYEEFFENIADAILWSLFSLIILLFRGNSVYAYIPYIILMTIYICKGKYVKKKKYIITVSITLILFFFCNFLLSNVIAKEKVSIVEMMSVPCQQLSRVYHYKYENLEIEEIEKYNKYFDEEMYGGIYIPEMSDPSKFSLRMDSYKKSTKAFWLLWEGWFIKYPKEYFEAFLENTYGLFYMWPKYVLYPTGKEGYTVIHPIGHAKGNSHFPFLLNFYYQFEDGNIVLNNGYVSWIFAPATYLYLMIVSMGYLIRNKKTVLCIPLLFVILLCFTFLFGPAMLVRYFLFLYIVGGVIPLFVYINNQEND